jgi:hypothetical protein
VNHGADVLARKLEGLQGHLTCSLRGRKQRSK